MEKEREDDDKMFEAWSEYTHTHTHISEPDRGAIRWPNLKKLTRKRRSTRLTRKRGRPSARAYWGVLDQYGVERKCERCGADYRITVHHRDGNPWNNGLENLEVLCWHCHALFHDPQEEGIHDEREGTRIDEAGR